MNSLLIEPIFDKTEAGKPNIVCCGYKMPAFNPDKHYTPLQNFLSDKREGRYPEINFHIILTHSFGLSLIHTPIPGVAAYKVSQPLKGWYQHLHRYLLPHFSSDEWYIFRGIDNITWRLDHFLNLIKIADLASIPLITTPSWSGGSHHAKIIAGSFACRARVANHLKAFIKTLKQQPTLADYFFIDEKILNAWIETNYFGLLLDILGPLIHFQGWTELQKRLYLGPRTLLYKEHCGFHNEHFLPALEPK